MTFSLTSHEDRSANLPASKFVSSLQHTHQFSDATSTVCGAGSMKRSGVRLSVARLSVPAEKAFGGFAAEHPAAPGQEVSIITRQKTRAVSHCPAKGQG